MLFRINLNMGAVYHQLTSDSLEAIVATAKQILPNKNFTILKESEFYARYYHKTGKIK